MYATHYSVRMLYVEAVMARPSRIVHAEPSTRVVATWSPALVRSAVILAQRSDFRQAGLLADAVLADDRVQAALGTRVNGLLGLPLGFDAERDNAAGRKAAQLLEVDWWDIAPEATLNEWVSYALLAGACAAELVWDTSGVRSVPRLRVWHPSTLRRDPDTGAWSVTLAGGEELPIVAGDGKWALLTPFGERRAGTRGLLRGLAIPWLAKQYAVGDWSRYSEVHGSGTRVGKAPSGATAAEKQQFRDDLGALASDSAIVLPEGWDVTLLEAKVGSGEVFEKLIDWADKAIAVALLGQNLTTDVEGGSLAAAEVHERVRFDLVDADSEVLATTLHDHVVEWWAEFNLGDRSLAPWPNWDTSPPVDEAALATALSARAQALATLATAAAQTGLPIDWKAVAEQARIPLLEGRDIPEAPPPPAPELAGLRLASGDAIDTARGFARGQVYADRLVDVGTRLAADALAPSVQRVLELVRAATSYEELRGALLREFDALPVDDLADLLESSLVLAGLAGRLAVIDDA